ncbi:MAG: hypothetical protein M3Z06_09010 [Actinomycetota bacterium]|nr:hypothetical protein [Actinomycetota bacterium]
MLLRLSHGQRAVHPLANFNVDPVERSIALYLALRAGAFRARCSSAAGANVLQITPLQRAPTPKPSPDATWGLHLLDANIALGNLIEIVKTQAHAFVVHRP